VSSVLLEKGLKGAKVTQLKKGQFLSPGFVDTHTVSFFFFVFAARREERKERRREEGGSSFG